MHLKQSGEQSGSTIGWLVFSVLAEFEAARRSSEKTLLNVREFKFLNEIINLQISNPHHLSPLRRRHFFLKGLRGHVKNPGEEMRWRTV